jgi:UDP-N-acetylglucosamine--N-acetylmuramyl-(pentapeptide) pyrophosphoryl-undecaprenol N-acetylglucosamine transferase
MDREPAVVVAGGGTGGHLFPGLAIAREFSRRNAKTRLLYIGVAGKMEEEVIPAAGIAFHGLQVKGLKGMGPRRGAASILLAGRAVRECRRLLSSFRPDLVVGVGGYSSGPAGVAAWTLGVPLVIQEQNTVPGLTNRLLSRLASRICVSFERSRNYFPAGKVVFTGNPVREEALVPVAEAREDGALRLLVLGGSRGAAGVNRMVTEAVTFLAEMGERIEIVHQSGREDRAWVEERYRGIGLTAEVREFVSPVSERYAWADLVVSRSGAGAVSEVAANGLPAILIPLPSSAGGHQRENARWLVEEGGALMVEESPGAPRILAEQLRRLSRERDELRRMAVSGARAGVRDGAARIVTECCRLIDARG